MWQRKNTQSRDLTPEQFRQKAEHYCAMGEHCASEVRELLKRHGATEPLISDLIDDLYSQRFLSDERYCRAFTNDKIRFQGWGREKVRAALQVKRLPTEAISEALDAFPEEEYRQRLDDIAQRKLKQLQGLPSDEQHAKLLRHLLSRGFTYSEAGGFCN